MSNTITLDDRGNIMAATYHETLWSGVEAWYNKLAAEAVDKGWGTPVTALEDLNVQPMSYESNQSFFIPYAPPEGKKPRHSMYISIYRLESGRYELTCYNS
jgi:hypothetical protein